MPKNFLSFFFLLASTTAACAPEASAPWTAAPLATLTVTGADDRALELKILSREARDGRTHSAVAVDDHRYTIDLVSDRNGASADVFDEDDRLIVHAERRGEFTRITSDDGDLVDTDRGAVELNDPRTLAFDPYALALLSREALTAIATVAVASPEPTTAYFVVIQSYWSCGNCSYNVFTRRWQQWCCEYNSRGIRLGCAWRACALN